MKDLISIYLDWLDMVTTVLLLGVITTTILSKRNGTKRLANNTRSFRRLRGY